MDEYDIGEAFAAIEDELIKSMIRNMERHRAEETDEGIEWTQWQVEQLKALEKYKLENQKRYAKKFKDINAKIDDLIRAAHSTGSMEQEIEILEAIKKGFKGYRRSSSTMSAKFFRLNERKLNALIKATTDDMKKAETAVLRMANDQYRKAVFNAQVYANTGAGTYEKAVDMATKNLRAAGLNCVEYANGARHTLSDYADMAIRTASKRAYLQGEGEKRQEWGISTVIMNKRGNPCPKCLPWVGKILIDDVWSGGSSKDGPYPLMSAAIAAGLYHPRCKDAHTTYFEGISTPPDNQFTRKEIQDIENENRKEAERKYADRQAEKYERMEENSLDRENQSRYAARREEWEKRHENQSLETEQSKYSEHLMEYSPRKSESGTFSVDWSIIQSPEYRKKLEKLSDDPKVINFIEIRSKWALHNRNGLNTEELYAVSLDTGKEIGSVLGQQIESGVRRTQEFIKRLNAADKEKIKVLLIHNHPQSHPPSIADINALLKNKYVSGITLGHNGDIYYYTRPKREIPQFDFDVALRRYKEYTEITAMEKALVYLQNEYGFTIQKL